MRSELLEYSHRRGLGHIPSALSMVDYVDVLFTEQHVRPLDDYIVLGKPFGAQAYYIVWQKCGFLNKIDNLSIGVKHEEIPFVEFSEETMGNALGVAIGIAMTTNNRVWVNISDAALQMGNTLEALQFIGHHNIKNIFVTVDYNGSQVTGKTGDILRVTPCIDFCRHYHWWVQVVDGHNRSALKGAFNNLVNTAPNIVFCKTAKGKGVPSIEKDPELWHYRKIQTSEELQSLVQELRDI